MDSENSIGEPSKGSVVFENHGQVVRQRSADVSKANGFCRAKVLNCRYKELGEVCQTVSATYGMGGNNQPFVVCIQGSVIGRSGKNGPNGDGINEDISFTLNTVDKHAVVYAIDRESFNCGQNYARNVGINESGINSTLTANGPSAVGVPTYSSSKVSFFTRAEKEVANTLVATDYKDPPIINDSVETKYIVRRLTPKECARLQGFPTSWCENLETENPSEEDIAFWSEVFETHRLAMGKNTKPKTRSQIVKWLKNPHTDSAEYKLWGNGVALPCVVFVLNSIVKNYTLSIE